MRIGAFVPVNANEFVVAIDSSDPAIAGRLYHPTRPYGLAFANAADFASKVEDILDLALQSPLPEASFTDARAIETGAVATLRLDIMFRQHHSWQGKVIWVEKKVEVSFRSFLELLLLVNNVLASEKER